MAKKEKNFLEKHPYLVLFPPVLSFFVVWWILKFVTSIMPIKIRRFCSIWVGSFIVIMIITAFIVPTGKDGHVDVPDWIIWVVFIIPTILGYLGIKEPKNKKYIVNPKSKKYIVNNLSLVDDMKGHEFEYWCAELLKKNGFTNVEVTKGSGDQGVDVLAVKNGIRYAIQCKCYSSNLGNTPVQEIYAGKALYRCHVGVVMTNQYFTAGAVELAQATGVLLWDREKLQKLLESSGA